MVERHGEEGSTLTDFNSDTIEEFRANGGRVGGVFEGAPLLLLTHTGRRTGTRRTNPLMYLLQDDHVYVFASKGGHPHHPHWLLNLRDHPEVTVEIGTSSYSARAVEIQGGERDAIYARQSDLRPQFAEYQRMTTRTIPVIELAADLQDGAATGSPR